MKKSVIALALASLYLTIPNQALAWGCYSVVTNSGGGNVAQTVCDENDDDGFEDDGFDDDYDYDYDDDEQQNEDDRDYLTPSEGEAAKDAATNLLVLRNSIKSFENNTNLTPRARAQMTLELAKVDRVLTKINLIAGLVNSGVQITEHAAKKELGYALSELTALLAGIGLTITISNPITATFLAIAISGTTEWAGDSLVDAVGEAYGIVMYKAKDIGGWDYIICRNMSRHDNCYDQMIPPIIMDLTGGGIHLTSLRKSKAAFDLDNDGYRERVSWFGNGNAMLVYDINNSGTADDVSEFSLAKLTGKRGQSDLDGLRTLDSNQDGFISKKDREYSSLFAWQDNGDGISESHEMLRFDDLNIVINLKGKEVYKVVKGNVVANKLKFTINGRKAKAVDVFLKTRYKQID